MNGVTAVVAGDSMRPGRVSLIPPQDRPCPEPGVGGRGPAEVGTSLKMQEEREGETGRSGKVGGVEAARRTERGSGGRPGGWGPRELGSPARA